MGNSANGVVRILDLLGNLQRVLKRPDARRLGERLTLTAWRTRTFPVDPTEIARDLGIAVEPSPDLVEGEVARAVTVEGRARIEYRASETMPRLRFAIAHALGHHMLRHDNPPPDTVEAYSKSNLDLSESDANAFAMGLLMPGICLRNLIERKGVTRLSAICEVYGVSEVAAAERLRQERLI